VIAVDVSNKPRHGRTADTLELVLQTFAIMGQAIAETELAEADVVIRPDLSRMGLADFGSRRYAIEQGEKAAAAAAAEIRRKIEARTVWVPYRD
jgi:NTE family protein